MLKPRATDAGNWNAHYEFIYRRQARFLIRLLSVPEPHLSQLAAGSMPELHDMPKMLNWIDGFRLGRLWSRPRSSLVSSAPAIESSTDLVSPRVSDADGVSDTRAVRFSARHDPLATPPPPQETKPLSALSCAQNGSDLARARDETTDVDGACGAV